MIGELERIAGQCDGVRCDMAMLVVPEVFERTWGIRAEPFWPRAIARCGERTRLPVHGRGLLGHGMDAAAAGLRLRLRQAPVRPPARAARPARCAGTCARTWATRTGWRAFWRTTTSRGRRRLCARRPPAAAVLTYLSPGLRFFHQGQFEGRRTANFAAPGPRARRSRGRRARTFLRPVAGRASAAGAARRPLDAAGLPPGLGWQRQLGQFHRLRLGGGRRRAGAGCRQLRAAAIAVLRAPSLPADWQEACCACATCSARRSTTVQATIFCRAACSSTCRPGATTRSTCRGLADGKPGPTALRQGKRAHEVARTQVNEPDWTLSALPAAEFRIGRQWIRALGVRHRVLELHGQDIVAQFARGHAPELGYLARRAFSRAAPALSASMTAPRRRRG